MKLDPEELDVTSFDTGADNAVYSIDGDIATPQDPTPATFCRICPVRTTECTY